jgi:hypothetical protein
MYGARTTPTSGAGGVETRSSLSPSISARSISS